MDIKNFTDNVIRIGQYPHCFDVQAIPGYHSDYGVMATFNTFPLDNEQHFFQVRRLRDLEYGLVAIYFKWEEQEERLPDWIGDVVFDSRGIVHGGDGL